MRKMIALKIFIATTSFRFLQAVIVDSYYMPSQQKSQVESYYTSSQQTPQVESYYMPLQPKQQANSLFIPVQPKQQVATYAKKNSHKKQPLLRDKSNEISYDDELYVKPAYKYGYSVFDPYTLDVKSQWEHRDGDTVRGAYNMLEADGSMRIVEYISDKDLGFRAIVKKIPFYLDGNRRPLDEFPKYTQSKDHHQEHELLSHQDPPSNAYTSHISDNRLTQNYVHKQQKYHKQYQNNAKNLAPIQVYKRLLPILS